MIKIRFLGIPRSGRAYETAHAYETVAQAADSLYENGFRELSREPSPSAYLYAPGGITAHRGLSMPSNKWVAILDAILRKRASEHEQNREDEERP